MNGEVINEAASSCGIRDKKPQYENPTDGFIPQTLPAAPRWLD